MTQEQEIKRVWRAEVGALRALRTALTVLIDSSNYIAEIGWLPSNDRDDQAKVERTKAWNVWKGLALRAARNIQELVKAPGCGGDEIPTIIRECEEIIRMKVEEMLDDEFRPYREQLERLRGPHEEHGTSGGNA